MILGEVKAIYIDDAVISNNENGKIKIHAEKIDPIARLGGDEYAFFDEIIRVPRPQ